MKESSLQSYPGRVDVDTMRALILVEPGCLELRHIAIPEVGPGELLIRVRAATTCGTDLKAYLRGHPQIPTPGVFGHEYSGTVVAAGEGAPFEVGTDVMGVHSAPCQNCLWCSAGQANLCESIMRTKVLGSYAEYLLIPSRIAKLNVFEKPADVSFARASLLEPLACVAQALHELQPRNPTDRILVIGPGAIGLMFVAALRQMGIRDVTLAGRNRQRLALGESLGARITYASDIERNLGHGYDAVIECTGNIEVWESSVNFVRRGGKVILFGGCPAGTHVAFDTHRLHYDQINLISPFHFGTKAVKTAYDWLTNSEFLIDPILSGERRLEDAIQVFDDLRAGVGIKFVFIP